jgi:hypothetical protein
MHQWHDLNARSAHRREASAYAFGAWTSGQRRVEMTMSDGDADHAWGELAQMDDQGREAAMAARYSELATLSEENRAAQMLAMARAEYALSDEELRPFTMSRLRTWLSLGLETAQCIASSYDAVMLKVPGPLAMRRVGLVQTLAKEFSTDDQNLLVALVPGVFAGASIGVRVPLVSDASPSAAPRKKGWWPFGRR